MGKPIRIFCYSLFALTLSGCFGLMVFTPAECENDTPAVNIHSDPVSGIKKTPPWSSKADFLKDWGKPDKILTFSELEEVWLYARRELWCGVVPCFIVCAPLMLPVCDGYDQIAFREENAWRLQTRYIKQSGVWLALIPPIPAMEALNESACRHPIPKPLSQKISQNKTVFISVLSDFSEDPDYQNVTKQISDHLSKEVVAAGVFKAVALSSETADYSILIKIDNVYFSQVMSSDFRRGNSCGHKINLTVHIYEQRPHQLIGDYELSDESGSPNCDRLNKEATPYTIGSQKVSVQAFVDLIVRNLKGD